MVIVENPGLETAVSAVRLEELFARQVAAVPENTAVIAGARQLSYRALDRAASRLARHLRARGIGPGDLVGVCLDRSVELAVAPLAVLKAGAAYVPLEISFPADRLAYMLNDIQAKVVLVDAPGRAKLAPTTAEAILVDAEALLAETAADGTTAAPRAPLSTADQLAYVIYTSGSTGWPKGVKITHRAAVNTILDVNRRFHVGPDDRVLSLSSLGFDLSVYDLFGLWAAGGAVVLPTAAALRNAVAWSALLAEHRVTLWNSVPALMEILVKHLQRRPAATLGHLRLVLLSGDWIPVTLPPQIRQLQPAARVISLGGATEAAIWSICYPIEEVDPHWSSIPYGRSLANQTFYVLDEQLRPCPPDVAGELYIGGVGVAEGYLNRPELTAQHFLPDPWSSDPTARLYRTGDRGCLLPDGNIEFLGRLDQQVKVHGYRIELGEIESVLRAHPAVADAVVTVQRLGSAIRLLAHIVPQATAPWPGDALCEFLAKRLPAYMLPSQFRRIPALPLTANGKVDRRALAAAQAEAGNDCRPTASTSR